MDEGYEALILKELREIKRRVPGSGNIACSVAVGIIIAAVISALIVPAIVAAMIASAHHP